MIVMYKGKISGRVSQSEVTTAGIGLLMAGIQLEKKEAAHE